tara:strand:+ start:308 stop:940 length:633 start_codon:yes stop_codon:yes gene_type:complete
MTSCIIDDMIEREYQNNQGVNCIVQNKINVKLCFYCNHKFDSRPWQMPINKKLDTFVMWGNFCSLECARSFITYDHHLFKKEKLLSLLALYAMKCFGKYVPIEKAPDKLLLECYGGPLTIEKFRQENKSDKLWVVRSPEASTTHVIYDCYYKSTNIIPEITQIDGKKEKQKKRTSNDECEEAKNSDKIRRLGSSIHNTKKSLKLFASIES